MTNSDVSIVCEPDQAGRGGSSPAEVGVVNVDALRERFNQMLAADPTNGGTDNPLVREGICFAVEALLKQLGVYRGFEYLPSAGVRATRKGKIVAVQDATRRKYL